MSCVPEILKTPAEFVEQRRTGMAFAPFAVPCMPDRFNRVPTLQPDSTSLVEVEKPCW